MGLYFQDEFRYLLVVWQPAGPAFKRVSRLRHVAEVCKPSGAVTAAAKRTAAKWIQGAKQVWKWQSDNEFISTSTLTPTDHNYEPAGV